MSQDSKQRPRRPPMPRRTNFNEMGPARRPPMRSSTRPDSQAPASGQSQPAQQPPAATNQSGAINQFPIVTPAGVPFYSPNQHGQFVLRQVPLQFPQPVGGQPIQPQAGPTASSGATGGGAAATSAPSGDAAQNSSGASAGSGGAPRRPPIVQQQARGFNQQPFPAGVVSQAQLQQMQQSGQIMIPQQLLMQAQPLGQPIVPLTGAQVAPVATGSVGTTEAAVAQPAAAPVQVTDSNPPPVAEPPTATNVAQPPAATESPKRRGQPWGNKQRPLVYGWATIRQVSSGQSLQIECRKYFKKNETLNLSSKYITLLLDSIQCPSIGRRKKKETQETDYEFEEDEPFAFEAKEFTRKALLKATRFNQDPIIFAAWNMTAQTPKTLKPARFFGDVYIVSKDGSPPRSLSLMIVEAGWGELKMPKNPQRTAPPGNLEEHEFARLRDALENAKTNQIGKFQAVNPEKHKRRLFYTQNYQEVLRKYGDKPVDAIVDYVVDGCALRVEICPSEDVSVPRESNLLVRLAGVRIDRSHSSMDAYADEAKAFVEMALLDHDVKLRFVAAQERNLYAQVIHPTRRRIACALLYQGLAEYVEWVAGSIGDPEEIAEMKNALQRARDQRVKIWKHKTPTTDDNQGKVVTVIRILSGDKLEVRLQDDNSKETVRLSSIRAPTRTQQGDPEPFFRAAKEFLRSRTIGKQVLMYEDYMRPRYEQKSDDEDVPQQKYVTIYVGSEENVAESLLRKGLAKIIQHTAKDNPSRDYIKLHEAYDQAKRSRAYKLEGMADEEDAPIDFSALDQPRPQSGGRGQQKSRGGKQQQKGGRPRKTKNERRRVELFNELKRSDRRVKCVVEMIFSATKLKLFVEGSNAFITFQLKDIRCDRAPSVNERINSKAPPGRSTNNPGLDAWRHMFDNLNQREVMVEVLDHVDNVAIGNLFYNGGKNVAEELLERGLAAVITWRPRNRPLGTPTVGPPPKYFELEDQARAAKLGVWSKFIRDDVDDEEDSAERKVMASFGEEINIVVSHIASATEFWANREDQSQLVDEVASTLTSYIRSTAKRIVKGKLLVGRYNGIWSRCETIRKNTKRDNSWFVTFIDYGNRASLAEENLGKCPPALMDKTRYPALAFKCQLAGLRPPPKSLSQLFNTTGEHFASHVLSAEEDQSKVLKFKVLYDTSALSKFHRRPNQTSAKWGELFDGDVSINKMMARDGFARLEERENLRLLMESEDDETKQYVENIKSLRNAAFAAHINIWRRGDINTDDEGDDGR